MSYPFLAEIRIFPFGYAPQGWAMCQGQSLSIQQSSALFSLLGTTYGGDGVRSFNLPNLQGKVPNHLGQAAGLSQYDLGQAGGTPTVTLTTAMMPNHTHPLVADTGTADSTSPSGRFYAFGVVQNQGGSSPLNSYVAATPDTPLRNDAVGMAGGNAGHNNMMPFLVMNFCIALQGVYPQRP